MIKHSPLYQIAQTLNADFEEQDGWLVAQGYGDVVPEKAADFQWIALCDLSEDGKIRIQGQTAGSFLEADELAINEGKVTSEGRLYRLRQDLYFLCAVEHVTETVAQLDQRAKESADLITVTDVSHGNAELWLIGPRAPALLSRICGLDFHDSQFPEGAAKQSSVAKTTQIVIRHDLADLPAYILIGPRSLAAYLWHTIMEAGQDLGILPVAKRALEEWT
jgi:sarcosine oxidase subunit gamma